MVGVELFRRPVRQSRMRTHLIVIAAPASQNGASFAERREQRLVQTLVPETGIASSLAMLPAGVIFTLVYVWRRDITALILAHVATDLVGLLSIGTDKSPDNMDN